MLLKFQDDKLEDYAYLQLAQLQANSTRRDFARVSVKFVHKGSVTKFDKFYFPYEFTQGLMDSFANLKELWKAVEPCDCILIEVDRISYTEGSC